MAYGITTTYKRIKSSKKRITIVQGGTSAGKTIAILLILLEIATREKKLITIVSESYPHLKRGALRDFRSIIDEDRGGNTFRNYYQIVENKADHIFEFSNGSVIEFMALNESSARGARRDILFINEANLINFETYQQLEVRTKEKIFIDFNPVNEFWAHTELLANPTIAKDCEFMKLTYIHNESLSDSIVRSIESRKGDGTSNWWKVYGLGEIGSLEGNVYEGWTSYSELPKGAVLKRYGVDFGFSNDPTAVIAIYEDENNEIYLETKVLQTKLLTPTLVEKLRALPDSLFVCDNARPEIIAELNANGIRAIGCDKTPGEKMNGKRYNIELVQRRKMHYLETDKELEREYLTYAWRKKKTGEILDEPQDGNDHCMDAIAYAIRDMEKKPIQYGKIL